MTLVKDGVIGSFQLKERPLPSKSDPRWEFGGTIQNIYLYPVKSCAAISVKSAKIQKYGLEYGSMMDRQFLIVNQNNKLVTGRMQPKLVLVKTWIQNGVLKLEAPGMNSLELTLPTSSVEGNEIVTTSVFGKACTGLDLGHEVGQWFAKLFQKPDKHFKLIYHIETQSTREFLDDQDPFNPMIKKDDVPLYADDCPILLTTVASFQALNDALEAKNVAKINDYEQLRPCILVKDTSKPWDEDDWLYIMINETILRNVKKCTRCIFTTVDPNKGEKRKDGEPLKTLKEIRVSSDPEVREAHGNGAPYYGIFLGVNHTGDTIHQEDHVKVIRQSKN